MNELDNYLPDRGIKNIKIRKLFGRYNYDFPAEAKGLENVAILYGDNGTGKTTVLNLIFHMLSPGNKRGHRGAVSKIPFVLFELTLNDGTQMIASRDKDPFDQSYDIKCVPSKGSAFSLNFDMRHPEQLNPAAAEIKFHEFLRDLNLTIFVLSADRQIHSDNMQEDASDEDDRRRREIFYAREANSQPMLARIRHESLDRAIRAANIWISRHALVGTNIGSDSANEIYERIVKQLASASVSGSDKGMTKSTNLGLELINH